MSILKGACIIGQSGGPTSVINASARGVIETALKEENITQVLAAENGILGILEDRLFDCGLEDPKELECLSGTPSSSLGSCRYKLKDSDVDETDYKRILEIFKKYNIRYFFYNGGNDSMDTCNKVSKYMQKVGYECRVMGVPKTIDNDLAGTDHCPGFGSAAKYIATSIAEASLDAKVYGSGGPIVVFEIMGRNAGWLAASSALANLIGEGPDLIYLPEVPFDMDQFLADVDRVRKEKGGCIVAVSEGIQDKDGVFISEYGSDLAKTVDAFGHSQMGGLASTLANRIKEHTGAKVRGIEFSLLQRSGAHCASGVDLDEAYRVGEAAVKAAVNGETDKMIALKRADSAEYHCDCVAVPLSEAANAERKVPLEWMNAEHNGLNEKFYEYALPLIQGETLQKTENGLPRFAHLKKIHP